MTMNSTYHKKNHKNDDDDELDATFPLMGVKKKPYYHYEQIFAANHIHFYISEHIGEPNQYFDIFQRLATATPNDVVFFHLNTQGGNLDTGVQLINAMDNSEAHIVTIIEGMAHSLGSLIFLSGDELMVNDNCLMMIHNFSGGLGGKGNELTSQLNATIKWFKSLAKQKYIPFLTKDEVNCIIKGEDMWMASSEIRSRLNTMSKILEVKQAKREKRARKEFKSMSKKKQQQVIENITVDL